MIHIRPAKKFERKNIVELASEQFGDGYLVRKELDIDRYIVLYVDDDFSGFVNTDFYSKEEWDEPGNEGAGMIETIAVKTAYQRLGLGTALIGVAKADLILGGATAIYCYAANWSDLDGLAPVASPLQNNGFKVKDFLPRMWKDDPPGYKCRACGYPCNCDATLYVWKRG